MIQSIDAVGDAAEIRVTGTVQGVGFRPTVFRLATEERLVGEVFNDGEGVLIRTSGSHEAIARLVDRLGREAPPLARIESIRVRNLSSPLIADGFRIRESEAGDPRTRIACDAAICADCRMELLDPRERRFGYPFVNCTNCGPRFSIVARIPWDRANTTMSKFVMCAACREEYERPEDRRFHAEAIACADCGPQPWLESLEGGAAISVKSGEAAMLGAIAALLAGRIVAIRGLGGFHLACDATDADAVARLRERKHRDAKPLAIMVRDACMARRYCRMSVVEQAVFESPEAPIVILSTGGLERLPELLAPRLGTLGVMKPTTPLHLRLLEAVARPLVMTSGNLADEPQIIANQQARSRLAGVADFALMHDRKIAHRIDDSLVRVMAGRPRVLRRARGQVPATIELPPGFADAPPLLAFGSEQKATFCLLGDGAAVLSAHQGDLDHVEAFDDYETAIAFYSTLVDHRAQRLAADLHPEYRSTKLAVETAAARGLPLTFVQHHHAHVASGMAEHGLALDSAPVLGVALDGIGLGSDGTAWGGEFLLARYGEFRRLASLSPVALPGGDRATLEPWRSLVAHVARAIGWSNFEQRFPGLDLHRRLAGKPLVAIERILASGLAVPQASSCGRLFDAVAVALGCGPELVQYAAQPAMQLESLAESSPRVGEGYPFAISEDPAAGLLRLDPAPMWPALFDDLAAGTVPGAIAGRFHLGLVQGITAMIDALATTVSFDTVVLSGGCMQNRILLEGLIEAIESRGFTCLSHGRVPANDGGLALGQALVAAARALEGR